MGLIIIRSIAFHESNWDLWGLVVISSLVATIYQIVHKTITVSRKWVYFFITTTLLAAIVSLILGLLAK
jgi:Na+/H+-dicarboxylate symporter